MYVELHPLGRYDAKQNLVAVMRFRNEFARPFFHRAVLSGDASYRFKRLNLNLAFRMDCEWFV